MRKRIWAYKNYSAGAKILSRELGILRIKHSGSRFQPRSNDLILNWGSSKIPDGFEDCQWINHPNKGSVAVNKLSCFTKLREDGVNIPEFTTDHMLATAWSQDGNIVLSRLTLNGSRGNGIVVNEDGGRVEQAPLYVKYVKKESEYRVHIFNGVVVDVQQKRIRSGSSGNN